MIGEQTIDIPPPLGGVEEYRALTNGRVFNGRTSAAATQSAENVVGIDPVSGRARLSQRAGLSKAYASAVNGTNSIQDVISIVGSAVSALEVTGQVAVNVRPDPSPVGNQAPGVSLLTPFLAQDASASLLLEADNPGPICWDASGNCYMGYRENSSSKFRITGKVGTNLTALWDNTAFSAASSSSYPALGIGVIGTTLYFYCRTSGANNYELWRFSTVDGTSLDGGSPWKTQAAGTLSGLAQNATGADLIDNCLAVSGDYIAVMECTNDSDVYLRVFNTAGTLQANSPFKLLGPKTSANSYCINVIGDGEGNFFWSGLQGGDTAGSGRVGRATATGTSAVSAATYHMAAYSPIAKQLYTLNSSGNIVWLTDACTEIRNVAINTTVTWTHTYATPTGGVVLAAKSGTYDLKLSAADSAGVALSTSYPLTFNGILQNFMAVNQYLPNSGDSAAFYRNENTLITAGGTTYRLSGSTLTAATSGTQSLDRTANVIFSAQLDNRVYFADGKSTKYYNATTNTMTPWVGTGSGVPLDSIGSRPSLICEWRRRIILAGLPQQASSIFMSAVGVGTDFDYAPTNILATTAFTQVLSDAINCLVPYSNDILIVGGDHTIVQYSGDPQDGGRVDVVSDTIGMAWGQPYCRAPNGTLFFVGSRGGVYRMAPSTPPESMSSTTLNERMAEIDYSTHICRMAWDDRQQGFYLTISPIDSTVATLHYFYDARNNAWWPIRFANLNHNAVAVCVIDGPGVDDRRVLLGGRDGILREIDLNAADDDGTTITSFVFMGPLNNVLVKELKVILDNDSSNVTISAHPSNTAQNALSVTARWSDLFAAGENRSKYPNIYGAVQYLKLSATDYWSLEQITARVSTGSAGRLRRY